MGNRSIRLLCLIAVLLMLVGCGNGATSNNDDPNGEQLTQNVNNLAVYAPEKYRYALQQVFSHINLAQTEFRVNWSDDFAAADVVITDCLPLEDHKEYRILDAQKLQVQGIEDLTVYTDQGVIGIPVFLHLDSFWYDQLLYDNSGLQASQSLDSWESCSLKEQYPVLCDGEDMCALFWSVVAPYYLKSGGNTAELSKGDFQPQALTDALRTLENMRDEGFVQLSDQAWQAFTSHQAAYWVTGVDSVAAYYNHMANPSYWSPSLSFPFDTQDRAVCVVRADVLAVRKHADQTTTDRFLELFFRQQMMADLSAYSRMPLACHMNYTPEVVPALPQVCYTQLSSPTVDVVQVPCLWSEQTYQKVFNSLLQLMEETVDAAAAANAMQ